MTRPGQGGGIFGRWMFQSLFKTRTISGQLGLSFTTAAHHLGRLALHLKSSSVFTSITAPAQEVLKQSTLALPLGVNLIVNYSITTISLTFNSHLGTQAVAAASLASATYWMFGKLLVQSLCGALDTRASQV